MDGGELVREKSATSSPKNGPQNSNRFDSGFRKRHIAIHATGGSGYLLRGYAQRRQQCLHPGPCFFEEHLRMNGCTTWYETVEEMQKDLDMYVETYNQRRPHRGRGMEGRTRYQVVKAGMPRQRTRKPSAKKEVKKAA